MRTIRFSALGAIALTAMLHAAASAPVADAAMDGNRDAVKALLKQAADVNAAQGDGMTALHWAAMKNDADLVQTLLYAGANAKATTRIGAYTPLLLAAKSGNADVIAPLDVNARESVRGLTPAMFAAASNRAAVIDLLAKKGADLKATSKVTDLAALSRDPAALRVRRRLASIAISN
ncbi:MAG: ankyrin repeat domain-containing protein [Acidobacteria bacterium]|nr:ankyrin repeat domain-containing protein [Acidobacteriota bacterium]